MNVLEMFGPRVVEGELGIEIEIEGHGLPPKGGVNWKGTHDGSLRGEAMEYVLRKPLTYDSAMKALGLLRKNLDKAGAEVFATNRAGVHVHVNVQQMEMVQVTNFICLYMVFEDMLVQWCGDSRVGNLFCLRARDAEFFVSTLRKIVRTQDWGEVGTDKLRYASLNLKALSTYGSLEFRAMRSDLTPGVIEEWIDLLLCLRDAALQYDNPQQIIEEVSMRGPEGMMHRVFGEHARALVLSYDSIMEGVRLAQGIAYSYQERQPVPIRGRRHNYDQFRRDHQNADHVVPPVFRRPDEIAAIIEQMNQANPPGAEDELVEDF
jgi:hypothetical protein